MKKFLIFVLVCLSLFLSSLYKVEYNFSKYENLSVQIYTDYSNCDWLNNYSTINNGNGKIIFCNFDEYKEIKALYKISGATFILQGSQDVFDSIRKDLSVLCVEKCDTSFVGYTEYFDTSVMYDNKKVNVQGYFKDGKIYIGTPLILGAY